MSENITIKELETRIRLLAEESKLASRRLANAKEVDKKAVITCANTHGVIIGTSVYSYQHAFEYWLQLDGQPAGALKEVQP